MEVKLTTTTSKDNAKTESLIITTETGKEYIISEDPERGLKIIEISGGNINISPCTANSIMLNNE